mmetsp:Transcript_19302/g.66191  ORF Transcript_19302/g.66191 Transcript_19302/m.66191 type:complete len:204 (-) Transcript_19302:289-900(-)
MRRRCSWCSTSRAAATWRPSIRSRSRDPRHRRRPRPRRPRRFSRRRRRARATPATSRPWSARLANGSTARGAPFASSPNRAPWRGSRWATSARACSSSTRRCPQKTCWTSWTATAGPRRTRARSTRASSASPRQRWPRPTRGSAACTRTSPRSSSTASSCWPSTGTQRPPSSSSRRGARRTSRPNSPPRTAPWSRSSPASARS